MVTKIKKSEVLAVLELATKRGVRLPTDEQGRLVAAARHLKEKEGDHQRACEALEDQFGVKRDVAGAAAAALRREKEEAQVIDVEDDNRDDAKTRSRVVELDAADDADTTSGAGGTKRGRKQRKEPKERKEEQEEGAPSPKKRKPAEAPKVDVACAANEELVAAFKEMAKYEFEEGQRFKGAAYNKVAKALSDLPTKVKSGKECLDLPGVGKASGKMIDQYLESGKIDKLEEARHIRE